MAYFTLILNIHWDHDENCGFFVYIYFIIEIFHALIHKDQIPISFCHFVFFYLVLILCYAKKNGVKLYIFYDLFLMNVILQNHFLLIMGTLVEKKQTLCCKDLVLLMQVIYIGLSNKV